MFFSSSILDCSPVAVIADKYSFNKKYFDIFFKEPKYDIYYIEDTPMNINLNRKVYYVGSKALEYYNKPSLFKKDLLEIFLPYLPKDFNVLKNLLLNDSVDTLITNEDYSSLLTQEITGLVSFYLKEENNKLYYYLFIEKTNQMSSGKITKQQLSDLLNFLKNSILIVFSSNELRKYLSSIGILFNNKTYDVQIMHYIVTNQVLEFSIKDNYAKNMYQLYKKYMEEISNNNQIEFMKHLFTLKDLFGFLETKGVLVDTTKGGKFLQTNSKFLINSRFYSTFNNLTFSGRVYTNNPSITNVPRDEKNIFKAVDNKTLFSMDFNQLELRVLYSLLNNKELIDSCNSGVDFHSKTASIVLNKPIYSLDEEDRQEGKKHNFYILYGDPEKNNTMVTYFKDVLIERRKLLNKFITEKQVRNPFGRILHITEDMEEKSIFNFFIQSTASDLVFSFLLLLLSKIGIDNKDVVLYNIIHDELIFELPDNKIEILSKLIQECLLEVKNKNEWLKTNLTVSYKGSNNVL